MIVVDENKQKILLEDIKVQRIKLRGIINSFDPLGIGEGFPDNEYDDLISRIISILNKNKKNFIIISELLVEELIQYSETNEIYDDQKIVINDCSKNIITWWVGHYETLSFMYDNPSL